MLKGVMMKKQVIALIAVVVGVLVLAGGVWAYTQSQDDQNDETVTPARSSVDTETNTSEDAEPTTPQSATEGAYVTLADYNADSSKYADSTKVYFFHAPWCEICQGIDKEITSGSDTIPDGVTMIKTDFDTNTELRQKYGVTIQYTFVQVDNDGNLVAKWNATNLDKALAGIES